MVVTAVTAVTTAAAAICVRSPSSSHTTFAAAIATTSTEPASTGSCPRRARSVLYKCGSETLLPSAHDACAASDAKRLPHHQLELLRG
eukprot:4272890-Pleurochrysis_carterae.AAC.2